MVTLHVAVHNNISGVSSVCHYGLCSPLPPTSYPTVVHSLYLANFCTVDISLNILRFQDPIWTAIPWHKT